MIIKLFENIPFVKHNYIIKRSNTKQLELVSSYPCYYHCSAHFPYKHPIIIPQCVEYLVIGMGLLLVTIIPNKNLLSMTIKCDDIVITDINSKLLSLVFDGRFTTSLRLSKNLKKLRIYYMASYIYGYNQHLILPKHLKHLELCATHGFSIILPSYIKRIILSDKFDNLLVLDGLKNDIAFEYRGNLNSIVDNFPNNVYDIYFGGKFDAPLNNLSNCVKTLSIENSSCRCKNPFYHRYRCYLSK